MTTTQEQGADLQLGDVVRARHNSWPEGSWIEGPTYRYSQEEDLWVCGFPVPRLNDPWTVAIVSRAPRPLYVNHPRTEAEPGDVVRSADTDEPADVWLRDWEGRWIFANGAKTWRDEEMPSRLRLLVDGETGQVVPS